MRRVRVGEKRKRDGMREEGREEKGDRDTHQSILYEFTCE